MQPLPPPPPRSGEGEQKGNNLTLLPLPEARSRCCLSPPLRFGEGAGGRGLQTALLMGRNTMTERIGRALWAPAVLLAAFFASPGTAAEPGKGERHLLYVVAPGIRNLLDFGGAGILVFDMDRDHSFVKRIETPASREEKPENIKGVCACAATRKLYFSTLKKLYCVDLVSDKTLWEKALSDGCDRMSMTPDGKVLYVPTLEKEHWNVVDGATGDLLRRIETKSGSHNTVVSVDGSRMYMAGLKSPLLPVADTKTHEVVQKIGPFSAAIRPFTVGKQHVYVNVNGLLGF